jgi:hypothetical protein
MLPDLSRLSLTDASIQNRSAPDGLSDEFKSIALDSGRRTAEGAIIYKFGEGEPIKEWELQSLATEGLGCSPLRT